MIVAAANGTPMPSTTATQPAVGLPSLGPKNTNSQKLTNGERTPIANRVS